MEQALQEISNQQKATWNKSSPGWKKWDALTMDFLRPYGEEIIRHLDLKDTDTVLDVAAGTGEPGLMIASIVKNGSVMITDLADDMLVVAYEKTEKAGFKNVEFSACDVSDLPFADNGFDAISSRMGFMFFPDMLLAVKEMMRVLKPGGKIAIAVWGAPANNFWFAGIMSVIKNYIELPQPAPGSPGMFRCAENGLMTELFTLAGLKNIVQTEITSFLNCRTVDTYWDFMSEVVGPVVMALSQVSNETREKIRTAVYDSIHQKYPEGNVRIESLAYVISGENSRS